MARIVRTAVPETQYARNGDTHLAYQTLGEGPPDIVWGLGAPGTHVEQMWEEPTLGPVIASDCGDGKAHYFRSPW